MNKRNKRYFLIAVNLSQLLSLLGIAITGLAGVLARNISLEVIPIFITILFILFLTINNLIKKITDQAAEKAV